MISSREAGALRNAVDHQQPRRPSPWRSSPGRWLRSPRDRPASARIAQRPELATSQCRAAPRCSDLGRVSTTAHSAQMPLARIARLALRAAPAAGGAGTQGQVAVHAEPPAPAPPNHSPRLPAGGRHPGSQRNGTRCSGSNRQMRGHGGVLPRDHPSAGQWVMIRPGHVIPLRFTVASQRWRLHSNPCRCEGCCRPPPASASYSGAPGPPPAAPRRPAARSASSRYAPRWRQNRSHSRALGHRA